MGYACPVCGAEQADAVHLANHLAVTASLGRDDHQQWLAEHAPDWNERTPEQLGDIVSGHAPEIETPDFADGPGHDHGRPSGLEDDLARQTRQPGRGDVSAGAEDVLEEARELTRQLYEGDDSNSDADSADESHERADESRNENV